MNGNEKPSTIIHPHEWRARMQALGLSMTEVAKRAGISHATLSVGLRGSGNFERRTMDAVSNVIRAEEERLRKHLGALPDAESAA